MIYIIFYLNLYLHRFTLYCIVVYHLITLFSLRGKTKIKKPVNTGKTTNIVSQEKNSW
jgi:hypothetical protein